MIEPATVGGSGGAVRPLTETLPADAAERQRGAAGSIPVSSTKVHPARIE
jgi:hypothetical protein